MLTVTGPGFSASSCSRPPAANRVRGACWACAARWCCSGACSVQDGRGSSRTSSSSSDFTVLHKFAADVLLEGNASFLLLCLFRRDGMTEQQDGWRGEDGGGGGVQSVWTGPGVTPRPVTQILQEPQTLNTLKAHRLQSKHTNMHTVLHDFYCMCV